VDDDGLPWWVYLIMVFGIMGVVAYLAIK